MKQHKSFAFFIILKREFSSGYMRKKPSNPTKLKYFNHLLQEGLISATQRGYRLKNFRDSITQVYGYQFKIINYSHNIQDMSEYVVDGLVYNKLKQQYRAAKSLLVAKTGNVVRKKGLMSIQNALLAGKIHKLTPNGVVTENFNVMTSSRAIADKIGISQTMANNVLKRLEKLGMFKFDPLRKGQPKVQKYVKGIFNNPNYVWYCERYLVNIVNVPFNSIFDYSIRDNSPIHPNPIMS